MIVRKKVSLAPFNTFGVDQKALLFAQILSIEDLKKVADLEADPYILGGGSNILLTKDIDRLVIKNELMGKAVLSDSNHEVVIKIGSGENWHSIVKWTVGQGWGGLENLSLIPGTVGAAPVQNIGAYGTEIKDTLIEVEAMNLSTGKIEIFSAGECGFGYRDSIFKHPPYKGHYFITHIVLKLNPRSQPNTKYADIEKKILEKNLKRASIQDIHQIVMEVREQKLPDPKKIGNAGSFFKNPIIRKAHYEELLANHPDMPGYPSGEEIKVPAGWLIDRAGWKGKAIGQVGCYEKQALVIVNRGGATGHEILQFSKLVQKDILDKYGINLLPEINIW